MTGKRNVRYEMTEEGNVRFSVEIRDVELWRERKLEVELYLDKHALQDLLQQLSHLKNPGDHCHFMTPTWGGSELSEEPLIEGNAIVDHLRVTLVE
jgi:hypothetical protein